jgi:hypothetical protein
LLDVLSRPESKDSAMVKFSVLDSGQIKQLTNDVAMRARDQLPSRIFLLISNDVKELYIQSAPLMGRAVSDKFSSLDYEISEIGKCLALGRSTASAFHSIRCLEGGIHAISRCLGIADPTKGAERSWHNILIYIRKKVDERWPASSRMSGDGKFFDEIIGTFSGMQNPYRNSTAHLDKVYTEDDAKGLFIIVKGIMTMIASRMDEDGNPRA